MRTILLCTHSPEPNSQPPSGRTPPHGPLASRFGQFSVQTKKVFGSRQFVSKDGNYANHVCTFFFYGFNGF